jgi:hypothetical protein
MRAHTRSRSGQAERAQSMRSATVPSAAATWPSGSERSICSASDHETMDSPFADAAEPIDLSRGPVGEMGEGALDDFLAYARGLAEEHGGRSCDWGRC